METTTTSTWTLSRDEFDTFLARLDSDRTKAGAQYENMRAALVRYFARYGHIDAQDWADQTMDRLVRKNFENQIDNLTAYMYAVARWVRVENHRKSRREVPLSATSSLLTTVGDPHERIEQEQKRAILMRSTQQLSSNDAALLAAYFPSGDDARGSRRALALALGISAAALRLRLCRARRRLERATFQRLPGAAPRTLAAAA
jgi:DNA-directed RNA polymerase specialized sigma24 family protein